MGLTAIISYISIVEKIFHGDNYKLLHAQIFPWMFPASILAHASSPPDDFHRDRHFSIFDYALHFFVWLLVETGIILARIFVPNWHFFFDFMQELQVLGLFWILELHSPFAKGYIGLAGLISYHSVMVFLFSGMQLFFAIFFPWFATISMCVCYCFWAQKPLSNNILN